MHNAAQDKSCDKRDYSRHQMLVFDVREDVISLGPRVVRVIRGLRRRATIMPANDLSVRFRTEIAPVLVRMYFPQLRSERSPKAHRALVGPILCPTTCSRSAGEWVRCRPYARIGWLDFDEAAFRLRSPGRFFPTRHMPVAGTDATERYFSGTRISRAHVLRSR